MAYFTKHRPDSFLTMIGHSAVVKSVKVQLAKEDIPHAWLFTGPSGIGKTTIARIIASELGASRAGIYEQNSADVRGIDGIRTIIKQSLFKAPGGGPSVIILDECHKLTIDAQNALLKALEDAPTHVFYILCTTEPEKLIETVRQRCLQYRFNALTDTEAKQLLTSVIRKEEISIQDEIVSAIIENANGSPRLLLNMLEKVEPLANDYDEAVKLIIGMAQTLTEEGPVKLGDRLIEMLVGRNKSSWDTISTFMIEHILYRKEDIALVKRALLFQLGKLTLKAPTMWHVEMIEAIEKSLTGINSESGFIALMYKLWNMNPLEENRSRTKPSNSDTVCNSPIQTTPQGSTTRRRRPSNSRTDIK